MKVAWSSAGFRWPRTPVSIRLTIIVDFSLSKPNVFLRLAEKPISKTVATASTTRSPKLSANIVAIESVQGRPGHCAATAPSTPS